MAAHIVDVLVNLIGNDVDLLVFCQHFCQTLEFFLGIDRTRRVARRAENQSFGLRRDGGLKLGGRDFEILLDASFNNDRFAASKLHHFGIAHPIGGRHDDLVAVVDQRHDGVANRLFGTVGAADLVGSIVQSVFTFQFLHDSLAQSRISSNGRIA